MNNMQTKVMAAVKKIVESAGLEMLTQNTYVNVGSFRIQHPDEFDTRLSCAFDFQNDYFTMQWYEHGNPHMLTGGTPDDCIRDNTIKYGKSDKIDELLAWVKKTLTK